MTKIDETTIDDAEGLDLVMSMCNLIKYSLFYFETAGSLWFYEASNFNANIANDNNLKPFECKAKLLVAYPNPIQAN